MTTTYEAWSSGRPTLARLPGINEAYSGNNVADWLTDFPDRVLTETKTKVDDLPRQLDPLTCDEEYLDWLSGLCGWYGIWDEDWDSDAKRLLLSRSYDLIWRNKGTLEVLSFVLTTLGIQHIIQPGTAFIIGINEVGDEIGTNAWTYQIVLPPNYYGREETKITERINELFGPVWCSSQIVYEESFFSAIELLALDSETVLSTGDNEALEA